LVQDEEIFQMMARVSGPPPVLGRSGSHPAAQQLPRKPNNLIQTIERVSLILDSVGQHPEGMTIRDLSLDLKLPKGTIHRILSSLSYFGYIRQSRETKNYFLGLKLMELSSLLGNQLDLRKVAEPILRDLAESTRETVHMVVLDANEIVYIDKIETEQVTGGLKMASRVGSRNPVHSCAVGKALAAHLSEEELDLLIREKGLPRRTANTVTNAAAFKEHLKIVRNQGYAIDDEENERGIRCLAAPLFGEKGRPVAAISVSGPAFRVTKKIAHEILRKRVVQAASDISQRLGFNKGGRPQKKGGT
jgi:IclR family KDG regulon transcriptional repressor